MSADARVSVAPSPIGFDLGDRSFTYRMEQGEITVRGGLGESTTVVALRADDWDRLLDQTRTFINLFLARDLRFIKGDFKALVEWEPLLTEYHCGIPVYDPTRVDLSDIDLARTFTTDDPDDEILGFLSTTGFAHLKGAFSREAIAALDAEVDRLASAAIPDDGASWWVEDAEGKPMLCRLVYAGQRSELIAGFENDPMVQRLGRLLRPDLRGSARIAWKAPRYFSRCQGRRRDCRTSPGIRTAVWVATPSAALLWRSGSRSPVRMPREGTSS